MTSEELHKRQVFYDTLHHHKRVEELQSLPRLQEWQVRLLRQSLAIIERPVHGYHSVDLSDARYISKLDHYYKERCCEEGDHDPTPAPIPPASGASRAGVNDVPDSSKGWW